MIERDVLLDWLIAAKDALPFCQNFVEFEQRIHEQEERLDLIEGGLADQWATSNGLDVIR